MPHPTLQPPEKSASSVHAENEKHIGPASPSVNAVSQEPIEEEQKGSDGDGERPPLPDLSLSQVLEEVDAFLNKLSSSNGSDENNVPMEIPDAIEVLSRTVESVIEKCNYVPGEGKSKCCQINDEDCSSFFDAIDRLSKVTKKLGELSPSPTTSSFLNRTSAVLQRAMLCLEDELRTILENAKGGGGGKVDHHHPPDNNINQKHSKSAAKHSSFNNHNNHHESTDHKPEPEPAGSSEEETFPGISAEAVSKMNKIASAMIHAGYENECCILYSIMRRNTLKSALINLGFEIISIDDLQKMQWESLEGEIASWIGIVRECSTSLFSKERNLCESVFSNHLEIARGLFGNLETAVCVHFLNFAEAAVLTKRSAEKLFKFLDIYEAMRDLGSSISGAEDGADPEEKSLRSEIEEAKAHIGEAAVSMFCELENSIQSDNGRTPVPSGAVHPLTRYTMNYLEYACVYRDTLEQVFRQNCRRAGAGSQPSEGKDEDEASTGRTEFAAQLVRVMELLDANLDMKSRLYRDPSLRYIFLMNNGRYILQKIKGSNEIHEVMGDTWCRRRSSDLRSYHKNYQRETWYRLLQCLSHEGLLVNGKVSKPVLKERFKSFNAMFDDIHKTQSAWVVSDEQLQSELRVSISAVVTPAYRSFLGRFNQYLAPGRQSEKYIKYQSEDIESLIDELFDGNRTSMARRRT
ncbi:exocyst complex component EXO70B1 [Punica granatum]|uniref:Exocyst subunit Exo70 family protein n=2 Tax=Punica granatum TaxID=22663 RepID=A0A218XY92_PUNGR|nr:exocyst complex component EXO70B1 [Punica granatum]OWM89800.1 hypothetical protein CDL15_Pgr024548 [Punica granatum]PKI57849.1 hypothetical protein CRG98_021752 [Punica granatum]